MSGGDLLWDRELHSGPPPVGRHRKNSYMSETPVTDGEAIYVYVAHMGLYAYNLDGTERWSTALEPHPVYLEFGGGASPNSRKQAIGDLSSIGTGSSPSSRTNGSSAGAGNGVEGDADLCSFGRPGRGAIRAPDQGSRGRFRQKMRNRGRKDADAV